MSAYNVSKNGNQFPIQPGLEYNKEYYLEKKIQWNPITENAAVFFQFRLNNDSKKTIQIVPDGCIEILFCCDIHKPNVVLYGKRTKCNYITLETGCDYFGFRPFYELGIKQKNCSLKELNNETVSFSDVFKDSSIINKIVMAEDFNSRISVFLDYTRVNLIDQNYSTNLVIDCNRKICMSKGNINISELCDEFYYTDRYVRKKYYDNFAISMKQYSDIIRFQSCLHQLFKNGSKVVNIAYDNGYFDQSHLIKEFKQMLYKTPKEYMRSLIG